MSDPGRPGDEPGLSVVVPAYNEEEVLSSTLERIHAYLSARGGSFEVLPIDDGSRDGTSRIARAFAEAHPECRPLRNETNRGKGYTVRRGIEEARGEFVLFSDADLSTPIDEAEKLLAELERGIDLSIGSRDLPGSDVRVRQPWYRETMGRIFNRIVRLLVLPGFADTQCGFKAFRRSAVLPLLPLLRIDRYSFDVEILFVARRLGLEVREVPVVWVNRTDTRVDPLRDAFRMLVDLLRIRYYDWSGCYQKRGEGFAPAGRRTDRSSARPDEERE
ncbi:MAG: dolichyl-phosphate beta-glucosyltransferase [Candidatus Eisenbacteria bacterium]